MPPKKIVCLANSKKYNHRCIAGKEVGFHGFGKWIRPVSTTTATGELTLDEITFQNGQSPNLLDIITVPLLQHMPHDYQVENYATDPSYYWGKSGVMPSTALSSICDNPPTLWINGYDSGSGINDRIPEDIARKQVTTSLVLIKPEYMSIARSEEWGNQRVRADFMYQGHRYKLIVTDPAVLSQTLGLDIGTYLIDRGDVYLCISLGEVFNGFCYKLVAGILPRL